MPSSATTARPMALRVLTVLIEAEDPARDPCRQSRTMPPVGSSRRSLQACMSAPLARSQPVASRCVGASRCVDGVTLSPTCAAAAGAMHVSTTIANSSGLFTLESLICLGPGCCCNPMTSRSAHYNRDVERSARIAALRFVLRLGIAAAVVASANCRGGDNQGARAHERRGRDSRNRGMARQARGRLPA